MISVLIPAFNETERIGVTLKNLSSGLTEQNEIIDDNFEIIVIDDGSDDETADLAEANGAEVIKLRTNSGKGRAINQGIKAAHGEIFLFIDADLGETAGNVVSLLQPIIQGEADLAIARFPKAERKGGFGIVKGLAHLALFIITGDHYYAPISGQRAMHRRVVEKLGEFKPGWGMEIAMTIETHNHGFRIVEVPLELSHRETGRDLAGFIHRGKQFYAIILTFFKAYWQYQAKEK